MKRLLALLVALLLACPAGAEGKTGYDYIGDYGMDGAVVIRCGGRYGLLDTTGREVFPCEWEHASLFRNGLMPVRRGGVYGVIDLAGNTVLPFVWDGVTILGNGSYCVRKGNLAGLLDAQGNQILPCEYRSVTWLGGNLYEVRQATPERLTSALFCGSEQLTDFLWSYVGGPFAHDRVVVWDAQDRIHVLNGRGEVVFSPEAIDVQICTGAPLLLVHAQDSSAQFVDLNGDPVGDLWDSAGDFHDGRARVGRDGKFGFLGPDGELALPLVYDGAWEFSEGLALVRRGGERYWIDPEGNRGASWDYAAGRGYVNGVAMVRDASGLYGAIDATGALVIPCQWQSIREGAMGDPFASGDLAWAVEEGGARIIAIDGRVVSGDRLFDWVHDRMIVQGEYAFILDGDTGEVTIWNVDGQVY